ncbi:MAG: 2-oxoacid:ferredoxin oxidoreductase subunit gamma [Ruminococcaceae bacterium]|nr:2-oxoacid:ferredoxin oxidoreductase subunit gamma [Oscillospiraceae bacterium]
MSTHTFVLAGFGGQGVLFIGKVISYSGMVDNKEVSWLPSYGPAMRGGTANCSVTVSDEPIGSPLVLNPKNLIALNLPSFDAFEAKVEAGGMIFADSSLIDKKSSRTDVTAFYIPATQLALDNGLKGLANMIIFGKMLKETGFTTIETVKKALEKCIPPKKADMLELNIKAIEIGYNY